MKAPSSFIRGEGDEPKNEALLFQSTVDIHFQKAHKTHKKLRRLTLCAFILIEQTFQSRLLINYHGDACSERKTTKLKRSVPGK